MAIGMPHFGYVSGLVLLVVLTGLGCQGNPETPASPSLLGGSWSAAGARALASGANAQPLIEVPGSMPAGGGGMANSVPTATPNTNVIETTIDVHGAPPNTDLYFQIAHDAYLGAVPARGNGVCDRVAEFGFANPPLHAGGDAGVIHTSPGGAGSTHIRFELPEGFQNGAYKPGATVDQMFRVVNLTKTFELRTPCMTLLMK